MTMVRNQIYEEINGKSLLLHTNKNIISISRLFTSRDNIYVICRKYNIKKPNLIWLAIYNYIPVLVVIGYETNQILHQKQ